MKERERQQVLDRLTSGRDRLLGLVEGLTSEQWSYRPAEGRWSTGECLEHVTIVEKRVIGIITGKIAEGAPASEKTAQEHLDDEALVAGVLDRSVRLQAPEPVLPGGKWTHPKDLIEDFVATRQVPSTLLPLRKAICEAISTRIPSWGNSIVTNGWWLRAYTVRDTLNKWKKLKNRKRFRVNRRRLRFKFEVNNEVTSVPSFWLPDGPRCGLMRAG